MIGIDIGNFLRAVGIATMFRSYARAFITTCTEGVEAGAKAFRAVSSAFKIAGGSLNFFPFHLPYSLNLCYFRKSC